MKCAQRTDIDETKTDKYQWKYEKEDQAVEDNYTERDKSPETCVPTKTRERTIVGERSSKTQVDVLMFQDANMKNSGTVWIGLELSRV